MTVTNTPRPGERVYWTSNGDEASDIVLYVTEKGEVVTEGGLHFDRSVNLRRYPQNGPSPTPFMENKRFLRKTDNVNQPKHYARWKIQPIELIAANDLPFWLANVIKYAMRYDAKNGLEDLYKARSYLDMQIRKLEGHERFWEKPVAEERSLNGKAKA